MIFRVSRCRFLCLLLILTITIVFISLYFKANQELKQIKNPKEFLPDRSFYKKVLHHTIPFNDTPKYDQHEDKDESYVDKDEDDDQKIKSNKNSINSDMCSPLELSNATIKTFEIFPKFSFNDKWVAKREGIWQDDFEERFKNSKNEHPLKIFILPHSHNDPGWLQTFTKYFDSSTKNILDLIVTKLENFKEMKFIWSEISFLDLWWQQAREEQKSSFKKLVNEGRIEIMTGGWVMTDEANSHYHAILDQLIEGHIWVKSNLNCTPKVGWSIDPFGQGSSVPHLLAASGFDGAIIQRIHYNWKEFLARNQYGDFHWKSLWSSSQSSEYTLLTHNMPFDIYSTRHSCGSQPRVCENFEFNRKLPRMDSTWMKKVDDLVGQYGRTASLFPHNVALVLVGGDFTYSKSDEFNQEYEGYKTIINHINANSERYNGAKAHFGTPSEYFKEIQKRQQGQFPTLVGDFFPYADIFSTGTPAYWTGYFTTRPFYKLKSRELEHNLRNTEILFTIAFNKAAGSKIFLKQMEKDYADIVEARRNLGLFQHHDAITGTSKANVMNDYLTRLQKSIKNVVGIQENAISFLLNGDATEKDGKFFTSNIDRQKVTEMPMKKVIDVKHENIDVTIFNSLLQPKVEVISLIVSTPNVKVVDDKGKIIQHQINPVMMSMKPDTAPNSASKVSSEISLLEFELIFIANLSAMSVTSFTLIYDDNKSMASVYCSGCRKNEVFNTENLSDKIEIENSRMKLSFDKTTGLLKSLEKSQEIVDLEIAFGFYKSKSRASGAYLFKPDSRSPEISDYLKNLTDFSIVMVRGDITLEVMVLHNDFLFHKVRIFNTKTNLDDAIAMINEVDLNSVAKNQDLELYMRLKTSIKNGEEFFSDQNGFQWMPRRKSKSLEVEGNYFPITTSAFMQDEKTRLTLITTHAQGATSMREGELEVMIDRKIRWDDNRGMGEGIVDNIRMQHNFFLTIEQMSVEADTNYYQLPSLLAQQLTNVLNYPSNVFTTNRNDVFKELKLFNYEFPCDYHLVNLRTLTEEIQNWLPSKSALFILHRMGYDCRFNCEMCIKSNKLSNIQFIKNLEVTKVERASLTALEIQKEIKSFNEPLESMEIRTYTITIN